MAALNLIFYQIESFHTRETPQKHLRLARIRAQGRDFSMSMCDKSSLALIKMMKEFFTAKRSGINLFTINHHLMSNYFPVSVPLTSHSLIFASIRNHHHKQQQPIDSCWSSSQTLKITAKSCPCNQINCNAPANDAKRR